MKKAKTYFKRILGGSNSLILGLLLVSIILSSCDEEVEVEQTLQEIESAEPTITSFSPESIPVLGEIEIKGTGLGFVDHVFINDVELPIKAKVNQEQLIVQVPVEAVSGPIKVVNEVKLEDQDNLFIEAVSSQSLTVTYPEPIITNTLPTSTFVNETVLIEGENLDVISRVTFGGVEANIEFQENQVVVVTTPYPGTEDPVEVIVFFNTNSGEQSQILSSNYMVIKITPEPSAFPNVMSLGEDVTIIGENLNLTATIKVGGFDATIVEATESSLTFTPPFSNLTTGTYDVEILDVDDVGSVKEDVMYINGEYFEFVDFDTTPADIISLDLSKDPLVTSEIISDVNEQPQLPGNIPFGSSFYKINYGTRTGSTVGRLNVEDNIVDLDRLANLLDGVSFGGDPVLHFWMRTTDSPTFKIYVGSPRRELQSSFRSTGGEWRLIAVRLKDFVTGGTISDLNFRLSPTSAGSQPEVKSAEYDWFIVTDKVLTEFGALDYSDTTTTTDFWKAQ